MLAGRFVADYDIRKLIRRAKGTEVVLPGIEESAGGKAAYLKALRAMLREIAGFARGAETEYDLQELARIAVGLTSIANNTVRRILSLEAQRHTDTFVAIAKRAMGINLRDVVKQEDLSAYLTMKAGQNAALIKGLSDETVKRVSVTVYENTIAGNSQRTLQAELTKTFGFSDNRAKLIARNEMTSLNSDLTRIRHEQAGIKEYIWRTANDERVRDLHRSLNGKKYRYGEPTGAEGGLQPGKPINCRCYARGIVVY